MRQCPKNTVITLLVSAVLCWSESWNMFLHPIAWWNLQGFHYLQLCSLIEIKSVTSEHLGALEISFRHNLATASVLPWEFAWSLLPQCIASGIDIPLTCFLGLMWRCKRFKMHRNTFVVSWLSFMLFYIIHWLVWSSCWVGCMHVHQEVALSSQIPSRLTRVLWASGRVKPSSVNPAVSLIIGKSLNMHEENNHSVSCPFMYRMHIWTPLLTLFALVFAL